MGRWYLKAATQRLVGLMPYRDILHHGLQHYLSRSIRLTMGDFTDHLKRDTLHLDHFATRRDGETPRAVFEVGTGWHPILPIAMWLCGVDRVWTCDVVNHLNLERIVDTVSHFVRLSDSGELHALLPRTVPDRLSRLLELANQPHSDAANLLECMGMRTIVSSSNYPVVPDQSIDLIVSNVALEYVAPEPLERMSREFARMIAPEGVMSHDIDMQDQYSYGDRSIPSLNFLRFSDRAWSLINNPFIPLNRLRASDYCRAFERAGFAVQVNDAKRADLEDLQRVPLSDRFTRYDPEDVRILRAWFIAQPANVGQSLEQGTQLVTSPGEAT